MHWNHEAIRRNKARGFGYLHHDAPTVPEGLKPRKGVSYGCGDSTCESCYEPIQQPRKVAEPIGKRPN